MKKLILMLKKPYVIVIFVIFIIVLIFILMQISVKPVMEQVKRAFLSKDYYVHEYDYSRHPEKYSNSYINYIIYDENFPRYDINRWFNTSNYYKGEGSGDVKIDLKIYPIFTLHNFLDGYVWFWYDTKCVDEDGNWMRGTTSAFRIPVRMKIHRESGIWQVVEIYEQV